MLSKETKIGGILGAIGTELGGLYYIGAGVASSVVIIAISAAIGLGVTGVIGKDASGNSDRQKKK